LGNISFLLVFAATITIKNLHTHASSEFDNGTNFLIHFDDFDFVAHGKDLVVDESANGAAEHGTNNVRPELIVESRNGNVSPAKAHGNNTRCEVTSRIEAP
jgi:hypothetical protein